MADKEPPQPQQEQPAPPTAHAAPAPPPQTPDSPKDAATATAAPPDAAAAADQAPLPDAGPDALETVASIENQLGEVLANLNTLTGGQGPAPSGAAKGAANASIDLLRDVQLTVKIELGHTRMYIEDILKLGEGSVVELDKLAGDPVDVFVNDRLVARGEVLVLNDNFCVRIGEIISQD